MNLLPLILFAAGAAAAGPLDDEIARLGRAGYAPEARAESRVREGTLSMILYRKRPGSPGPDSWLYLYRHGRRGLKTLYMKAGTAVELSLAEIHRAGRLPDMVGDGTRIAAYREILPRQREEKLVILRYIKGRVEKVSALPFGEFKDVDGDGRLEILSRTRPLGKYFLIGCESKVKTAPEAFRTRVHEWRSGRLAAVSRDYPGYFDDHIASLREDIATIDARSRDADFSEFLNLTLSLFYDFDETGRGREGWKEFTRLFPIRRTDPGRVKDCKRKIERDIRKKLNIPPDW